MYLLIDIGNTNILCAIYDISFNFMFSFRMRSCKQMTSDEYFLQIINYLNYKKIDIYLIEHMLISSVVPTICEKFLRISKDICNSFIIDFKKKLPIKLNIDYPCNLGNDIICTASAAFMNNKYNSIVVDSGTATTITLVKSNGYFEGSIILPGFNSFNSIISNTTDQIVFDFEKVFLNIKKDKIFNIGKNTNDSLLNGTLFGYSGMIDTIISKILFLINYKNYKICLTGGNSYKYKKYSKYLENININDNLIFEGMIKIYNLNK